jgi:hypothetical protein
MQRYIAKVHVQKHPKEGRKGYWGGTEEQKTQGIENK